MEVDETDWPEEDINYYHLLQIKVDDKLYLPIKKYDKTADRLIHYYEKERDHKKLSDAYFYKGRIKYDQHEASSALGFFQKSLSLLPAEGNRRQRSLIYNQMGQIFEYQNLFEDAIHAYRQALSLSLLEKDTTAAIFDLRDIGNAFHYTHPYDSAFTYLKKALSLARVSGRDDAANDVLSQIARLHLQQGHYAQALQEIRPSLVRLDSASISGIYSIAGKAYLGMGHVDSARYYFQELLSCGNLYGKRAACEGLSEICSAEGDAAASLSYQKRMKLFHDSITIIENAQIVKEMDAAYDFESHAAEKEKADRMKGIWRTACLLLVVLLAIVMSLAYIKSRSGKQPQGGQDKKRFGKGTAEDAKMHDIRATDIYHRFSDRKSSGKKITDQEWETLKSTIEEYFPGFVRMMYTLCPDLSEVQLRVCLLTKMDLSTGKIAQLLFMTDSGIGSVKRRLYRKMTGKEGGTKDFNQFIKDSPHSQGIQV